MPFRFVPRRRRRYVVRDRDEQNDQTERTRERRFARCGSVVFFSFRFALRASRRSATSWMKTHTHSDSLRFPVIEKTVKQPTRGARADAARDARLVFPSRREYPARVFENETNRNDVFSSPVMKLQKGVSQKHHSQCPNFRVILPDSSGCPVEN